MPALGGFRTCKAQVIARALPLVPADSLQACRLLSLYGRVTGHEEGDYQLAEEAFKHALAIAQREQDLALEMRVLASASYVGLFHLRTQESLENGMRAIELADQLNDPYTAVLAYYSVVSTLLIIGDLEGARQPAADCLALAEGLLDRYWLVGAIVRNLQVAGLEGSWR